MVGLLSPEQVQNLLFLQFRSFTVDFQVWGPYESSHVCAYTLIPGKLDKEYFEFKLMVIFLLPSEVHKHFFPYTQTQSTVNSCALWVREKLLYSGGVILLDFLKQIFPNASEDKLKQYQLTQKLWEVDRLVYRQIKLAVILF